MDKETLEKLISADSALKTNQVGVKLVKTFRIVKSTRGYLFDDPRNRPGSYENENQPKIIEQMEDKVVHCRFYKNYREATDYLRQLKTEFERGGGKLIKISRDSFTVEIIEETPNPNQNYD